jgi:hypothetical protein
VYNTGLGFVFPYILLEMTTYSVQFVGYVIQDEFTEYHLKVSSSDNASWLVRRRYREFRELHDHLKLKYPDRIPSVPGKKLWGNQDPTFVRQRQDQLQIYMNGVLSLEPDCRTRVLQRFLEIKRPSGGTPVVEPQTSGPSTSRPHVVVPQVLAPQVAPTAPAPPQPNNKEEMNRIISELQSRVFDLSITPVLLDAGEYSARKSRYESLIAHATVTPSAKTAAGPSTGSPYESVAWSTGSSIPESAKSALSAAIGKGPIATENHLVAFFTIKPPKPKNPTTPPPASSSSRPVAD